MDSPRGVDLFLAMWNASINSEDSYTPGTPEWKEGKKRMQDHWLKIWIDCSELCKHISKFEALMENMSKPAELEDTVEVFQPAEIANE